MKANELRIGNLVYFQNSESKQWENDLPIEDGLEIYNIQNGACSIKPIPLTEEWLVKFGAYKCNEISEYFDAEQMYVYELMIDGIDGLFDRKGSCCEYEHIKHVHQLQNLYFALTGEELKIN